MQTITHELKADPIPFFGVLSGTKRCEVRQNDRGFKVGDQLRLREYDRDLQEYSGRECTVEVLHIQTDYGLPEGLVVMSITSPALSEQLQHMNAGRLSD